MDRNTNIALSFLVGIQLGLIGQKLVGWIDISWWWVFAPTWIPVVALLWLAAIIGGVALNEKLSWKGWDK